MLAELGVPRELHTVRYRRRDARPEMKEIHSRVMSEYSIIKAANFGYLLHVIPVGDDAVFHGIFQSQNASLVLSFLADVRVFLTHTNHHALMSWATNDGGKPYSRSIISGKTGLARTGAIIHS